MQDKAQRILVVNAKGGCGKTTVATNLASYFARQYSTLLVDQDPQGSSMRWLSQRMDNLPKIVGMKGGDAGYRPNVTRAWLMQNPLYQKTIIDAPAGVAGHALAKLVAQVDTILIPVQPSPIDISATADFIRDLLLDGKIRQHGIRLGIVANRVKANTRIYHTLRRFLKTLGLPFVGILRDTQNYVRAVDEGLGIHDLPSSQTEADVEQWKTVINWLQNKFEVQKTTSIREHITARAAPLSVASNGNIAASGSV
ncbi:MAG: AAA family ATPase [Gammaproteobacteria bacterium]|nr:AAA family ATPase [Gammaproteobacteria bacterium]